MAKNIITSLPLNDRPYEKLELLGPSNLTDSELIAIIIKTGTKNYNCLQISQNIISSKNNEKMKSNMSDLEYIASLSLEKLQEFEGIGRVKAIQIMAVIELSKRISNSYFLKKEKIISPNDIFNLVKGYYLGSKKEVLKIIILNKRNIVMAICNISGGIDSVCTSLKEILSEPIKLLATSIIAVHNHPGGSLEPSKADINFTLKLQEYSRIFNIELLDHIIIADNNYVSLKKLGILDKI